MFYDTGPGNNLMPQPYPQVFFPSDATAETATLLDVQPGVELHGINMVLGAARNYRVRGYIIDPRTGRPPAKVRIAITGAARVTWNSIRPPDHSNWQDWCLEPTACA